jgi:hypothetical protein
MIVKYVFDSDSPDSNWTKFSSPIDMPVAN